MTDHPHSSGPRRHQGRAFQSALLCGTAMALVLAVSGSAPAQDAANAGDPNKAVSQTNFSGSAGGGRYDGRSIYTVAPSLAFPLGDRVGAQIDTAIGSYGDKTHGGAGGSLFLRNPQAGALGVHGGAIALGNQQQMLGGVDGEIYLGPITLNAAGGYTGGDAKDGWYGRVGGRRI